MKYLNLGILAHVDAGKTSLTERLLYEAGAKPDLGSVDSGNTFTDSLLLERERGITIRSAVATFMRGDITVNLLDTPGHPDFIAEVERTLALLDVVIVVVSAVEGVQAQTRVLVNALQRLHIPHLFFINKVDRRGACFDSTVDAIAQQLKGQPLPMVRVQGAGDRNANVQSVDPDAPQVMQQWLDVLCEHDETLLEDYLQAPSRLDAAYLQHAIAEQLARCTINPVFAGSAITGVGIAPLLRAVTELCPVKHADAHAPVRASVFKVDRGWGGQRRFHLVVRAGTLRLRQVIDTPAGRSRITGLHVSGSGGMQPAEVAMAGQIACVTGLERVRIGDDIGAGHQAGSNVHAFTRPLIETQVRAASAAQAKSLWAALGMLAEQDPLIDLRKNPAGDMFVSLYGEVQKEIIQATLLQEHGLQSTFEESSPIYIEALTGSAEHVEALQDEANPFLATVGLRIAPAAPGSGVSYRREVPTGLMPTAFYKAIEETVLESLKQGLYGWALRDCEVTLIAVEHASPCTTAADFRQLTPLVLAAAIEKAGCRLCEPHSQFSIDLPSEMIGPVHSLLAKAGAAIGGTTLDGQTANIQGTVVTTGLYALQHQVPNATSGLGVIECSAAAYTPVSGQARRRERTTPNPFDRQDYLRQVKLGTPLGKQASGH